ncbi:MAG: HlyC/CorC family transporter [Polyangiaceae bacterium]|nr:HlyC/CorC family transporter [Polyangiaceae bacterium]
MEAPVPLGPLLGAAVSAVFGSLFAAADTSVQTLSSARLAALVEESSGSTRKALERVQDDAVALRSRYLLGRIVSAAIVAVVLTDVFRGPWPTVAPVLGCFATVVICGTLFEISTTLGGRHADRAAPTLVRWLFPLEILLLPFALPMVFIGRRLVDRTKELPANPKLVEHEVGNMVDQAEKSGLFGRGPGEIIRNVFEFADQMAREVMIPRNKVEGVELSTPPDQVLRLVAESGHSRYPVYKDQIDNVVGLLHAKDLFKAGEAFRSGEVSLRDILRPANFVAQSQQLVSLLRLMRRKRQHMVIVVDELGQLTGIVTLEDVLEQIVGDIQDEHDDASEAPVQDLGGGRFLAAGDVSIGDLGVYLGTDIQADADFESLGAMLQHEAGEVPKRGAEIKKFGMRFKVLDADETHVQKVEIVRQSAVSAPDAA